MDRNNKNQQDSHDLNKTIEQYCEVIINGKTYNLNNLINLNVIKAVYSDNNTKWYISNSEQEYTSYKELRKGLTDYIFQLHNGELWEVKEVIIPEEFDDVYSAYNEIQRSQGFDLTQFAGI